MAALKFSSPGSVIRGLLVRQVRSVFNDEARGELAIAPSDQALFEVDSPIRMVHADVVAMMVGGMRALLLQMLHLVALQGVLDHSDFREEVQGRLRRTARFIAVTTYGHSDEAMKAINEVSTIHARVTGVMPDGRPYSAKDPRMLAWVQMAEATSFLEAYLAYANPAVPPAALDRYFEQSAVVARMLGAAPVSCSRAETLAIMREMRGELEGSQAAH